MPSRTVYHEHAEKLERMAAYLRQYKLSFAELVFDLLFIVNFVVGKLIHVVSQEEEVYNYYNNKDNIFNQWFVKKGWGWTTLVIVAFYAVHTLKTPLHNRVKLASAALVRYAMATFWWVLFTQWCFGLPIMDKVFLYTGGKCALIPVGNVATPSTIGGAVSRNFYLVGDDYESSKVSSYSCRKLKGTWEGGHDPLGHVFLLVHASLYLFHEIKQFWPGWAHFIEHANVFGSGIDLPVSGHLQRIIHNVPHTPVLLLLSLWWFMLLVTNMHFHSLSEKLVGLAFGYLGVLAVYYVPRYIFKEEGVRVKQA